MRPTLHPLNAALRFLLELLALGALGSWGYSMSEGALRYVFAPALPLIAASIWGVFTVPGDPSRGKDGPVSVPGPVRLLIEAVFFAAGAAAIAAIGHATLAFVDAASVCLHYALAHARTRWLFTR
ncbi:MAG TPA: DUF2568 domain-containing protein [Polyangiales bacterium]|nr:DUF2568 domain-containing protein [Polyangiales bacterium]